jgi:hypothetical protein
LRLGGETAVDVLERCDRLEVSVLITTGYASAQIPAPYREVARLHKLFTLEALERAINQPVRTRTGPA